MAVLSFEEWKAAGRPNSLTGSSKTQSNTKTSNNLPSFEEWKAAKQQAEQTQKQTAQPSLPKTSNTYTQQANAPATQQNVAEPTQYQDQFTQKRAALDDEAATLNKRIAELSKIPETDENGARLKTDAQIAEQTAAENRLKEIEAERSNAYSYGQKTRRTELEKQQKAAIDKLAQIDNEAAWALTTDLEADVRKRRAEAQAELDKVRTELNNLDASKVDYRGQERVVNTARGFGEQWASGQVNTAGTLLAGGNALQDASSAEDRAINDSLYSGWVTDDLSRANFVDAGSQSAGILEENKAIEQKVTDYADKLAEQSATHIGQAKQGLGTGGQLAVDLAGQAIQMGLDAATGASSVSMFSRSFGSGAQQARQEGATLGEQFAYGALSGATEALTEKLFDGLAGVYGKGAADDLVKDVISKMATDRTGQIALRVLASSGGEALEETISGLLDPLYQKIYNDKTYRENLNVSELLYSALVGGILGGVGGVANVDTYRFDDANAQAPTTAQDASVPQGDIQTPPTTAETSVAQSGELNSQANSEAQTYAEKSAPPRRSQTKEEYDAETEELLEILMAQSAPPESAKAKPAKEVDAIEVATGVPAESAKNNAEAAPATQVENSTEESKQPTNKVVEVANATPTDGKAPVKMEERSYTQNVRDDAKVDENLRKDLEENKELYEVLSNKDTLAKAKEVYSQGVDKAKEDLYTALGLSKGRDGKKFPPEMVPLSRMIANELAMQGKVDEAHRIIADVAEELTSAGQLTQAAAILKNSDPATVRRSIEKALGEINNAISAKYNNRYTWRAKLTEAEIEQINNTDFSKEGEYEALYEQIAKRLGKEMPATLGEKLQEIRRINMLLRPRTMIKNYVGNIPMKIFRKGAERISGAIQDRMVKKGTLDLVDQTRTGKVTAESKALAQSVYEKVKDEIDGKSNKWDMNNILRENRTIFKPIVDSKDTATMEVLRKKTYELLEKGDAPFVKSAFVDSLAEYCAAHGIADADNVPQAAIDFATANAMEATFKAQNALAKALNNIKSQGGAAGAALDILFPFTTTPLNITKQLLQYSPAGLFDAAFTAINKGNKADIADKIGKGTVGSTVMAIGFILGSLGAISAGDDEDKDKAAFDKGTGKGKYSVQGDFLAQVLPEGELKDWLETRSISYDWAQPAGSLFALGAEIAEAAAKSESWGTAVFNAVYTAGDSVLNMSIFQNIMSILKGSGKTSTEQILDAIIEGGASQMVPGLLGDIAKVIDKTVRTTYTGGNVLEDSAAKIANSIPGLSFVLPESVGTSGEAVTRGGLAERTVNALANPGTVTIGERNAATDAITSLYEKTGDKTIFPQVSPYKVDYGNGYTLTGKEREEFQKTQANVYYKELNAMIKSGQWEKLSSEAQIKALQKLNSYALDSAKRALVKSRGDKYTSDYDDVSKLNNAGEYIAAKAIYDADIKAENYSGIDTLLKVYDDYSYGTQKMLSEKINDLDELFELAEVGVGAKPYFQAKESISAQTAAYDSQSDYVKLKGIGYANLSSTAESALVDVLLGKGANATYDAFADAGYKWDDVVDFLSLKGSNKDGSANKKEKKAWMKKNTPEVDFDTLWKILYP